MGKIETNDNQDQESLLKQITSKYIQEQLEKLNNTEKDNNSSIYLESDTLNMLMVYLLMKKEARNNDKTANRNESELVPDELIEALDSIIVTNQKSFNEIISLLKKET
ncbi:hypothetical protein [Metabacillus rhizolycopersici]|uniref:IDEAL domain-containing protein n=1 Tax=Metabacillus rhizolycopersici TaxID=2875709 RepID=A0ABS7UVI0_9BACI|nr:hypothetical protein [Metabacillus rhizolycopersici]MBZ5751983.1 hypothetical protein [Metabacillus rhizolycopersici]